MKPTMSIDDLRRNVSAEAAKMKPRSLSAFSRAIRVSPETIRNHCADLWAKRRHHQTAIYTPMNGKHAVRIHGRLLEAARVRPGAHLDIRVVGPRRILITATHPECGSLAVERWGNVS